MALQVRVQLGNHQQDILGIVFRTVGAIAPTSHLVFRWRRNRVSLITIRVYVRYVKSSGIVQSFRGTDLATFSFLVVRFAGPPVIPHRARGHTMGISYDRAPSSPI